MGYSKGSTDVMGRCSAHRPSRVDKSARRPRKTVCLGGGSDEPITSPWPMVGWGSSSDEPTTSPWPMVGWGSSSDEPITSPWPMVGWGSGSDEPITSPWPMVGRGSNLPDLSPVRLHQPGWVPLMAPVLLPVSPRPCRCCELLP